MTKSAKDPTDAGIGEIIDAIRNTALVHQCTCEDEERHRHHDETVHRREHRLHHHAKRHLCKEKHRCNAGDAQCHGDGYAHEHKRNKNTEKCQTHFPSPRPSMSTLERYSKTLCTTPSIPRMPATGRQTPMTDIGISIAAPISFMRICMKKICPP